MSEEKSQLDCPELHNKLKELKQLRLSYRVEADDFAQNPQYERSIYRLMHKKMEEFEKDFDGIYKQVLAVFPEGLYFQFLHIIGLNKEERFKLREIIYGYDRAVSIARKFTTDKGPSSEQILYAIMQLPDPVLKEIAKFKRPQLLIIPNVSSLSKVVEVTNQEIQRLFGGWVKETTIKKELINYFDQKWNMIKNDLPKEQKSTAFFKAFIVEGEAKPEDTRLEGNLEQVYEQVARNYQARGLKMISAEEWLFLMQVALKNYEWAKLDIDHKNHQNPGQELIDRFSYTAFARPVNDQTIMVPAGRFIGTDTDEVSLQRFSPSNSAVNICFRPSVDLGGWI